VCVLFSAPPRCVTASALRRARRNLLLLLLVALVALVGRLSPLLALRLSPLLARLAALPLLAPRRARRPEQRAASI